MNEQMATLQSPPAATPIKWDWDQGNVMEARSSEPNKYPYMCICDSYK